MAELQIGKLQLATEAVARDFAPIFNELQKKWRRFDKDSLVRQLLNHLLDSQIPASDRFGTERRGAMNFVATPLLVWVLADTYVKKEGVKTATKKDAVSLLNLAWNLSDCREAVETLSRNLNLAMRNIAIQQFEHQENLLRQDFSRTWLIFRDLQASSRLRKCFEEATDLSVEDALALVLMFSLAFGSFSSPKNDLRNLARSALERCPKFLVTLRAFDGVSLRSQIAVRHTAASIYAPSPFVRYPLLQLGKNLQVVDNHLAGRTAEMYAYRIIEEFGGPREKQQLTQCTEKYVNQLAKKNFGTMVWLGDEVTQIAGSGLSCDQVVRVSEHLVLLVEIKAAQLSPEKIISLSEDFLFSVLQQTVIKGYEQLAATKVRLCEKGVIEPTDLCISLVVTHENLRLSDGNSIREMLPRLGDAFDAQSSEFRTRESEFFVCTIAEYDQLLDLHASGKVRLEDFLIDVLSKSRTSADRRFNLSGYLSRDLMSHQPPHLEAARQEAFSSAVTFLKRLNV